MQCIIWTNPDGGLCNMDRCYKWQYLYKVLGKCFIGYIYRNIVQYCTWYNYSIRIWYNTYGHTGTCSVSACFISRGAIFSRSGTHGRGDCFAPFSAPCASLSALLKRTATITQAGAGSQALRSGTVAFHLCVAPLMSRIYLHQAITVKFLVWENTTCKEHHPSELTSKVTTEFACKSTSRDCIKNFIAEMTLQTNWNACKRCHRDRTKCNAIVELTLQTKPL